MIDDNRLIIDYLVIAGGREVERDRLRADQAQSGHDRARQAVSLWHQAQIPQPLRRNQSINQSVCPEMGTKIP